MTKILVTGSSGLIGRQVTKDLVEGNVEVYSCYHLEKPEFGKPELLDLSKKDKITSTLQNIKPDVIIHLAAITDVELCERQKELATLINTRATEVLMKEAAKQNTFFVYISTDYVFDGKNGMKNEKDIPNPLNFYGRTKLDGETVLKNSTARCVIVRTSTPFGFHPKKKSFPLWIKQNLEAKKEIPVIIDQYTSPTFVPNLSKMLEEVIAKEVKGIIHLAGATRLSRYEFAKIIADKLNLDKTLLKPIEIGQMNWKALRPCDSSLDITKANEILDNKPQKIEQSLALFIKQIKNI